MEDPFKGADTIDKPRPVVINGKRTLLVARLVPFFTRKPLVGRKIQPAFLRPQTRAGRRARFARLGSRVAKGL
jgi:hypothetical protein